MDYVALLRGINLGGHHSLPMATLRETLEAAGCADVRTYIQSGNAVFRHDEEDEARLRELLEAAIGDTGGFAVPVMLRTADEWASTVAANPYAAGVPSGGGAADPKALHVVFLSAAPSAGVLDALDLGRFAPEELTSIGRELHLWLPGGMGRSKLAAALTDRKLGAVATARNWNTVKKLEALLADG